MNHCVTTLQKKKCAFYFFIQKIYEDGKMLEGSPSDGFSTNAFAGKVFNLKKGVTKIQLDSSVTRSERGFVATWSPGTYIIVLELLCPPPSKKWRYIVLHM